jgi:glyceraldehyde 3-phosphate dehydrogenase
LDEQYYVNYGSRQNINTLVENDGKISLRKNGYFWTIKVTNYENVSDIDWRSSGVKCIIESSGAEKNYSDLSRLIPKNIDYGIITNTYLKAEHTLVFGVSEDSFNPHKHKIISSSICDAIAIAPVLNKISESLGILQCFVTTLHPWLSYQNLMDGPIKSTAMPNHIYQYYPLGRASVGALIPKPTTVGSVLEFLIPSLEGKVISHSYRIPTQAVCSADISLVTEKETNKDYMQNLLKSENEQIVRCSNDLAVSVDYVKEVTSSIVDLRWLNVKNGRYVKIVLWYDNEWGYASKVIEILNFIERGIISNRNEKISTTEVDKK